MPVSSTATVIIPPPREVPARPFRVLVTGSRGWRDRSIIYGWLNQLLAAHGALVVVHGACSEGADKIADDWFVAAKRAGARVCRERKPARWRVGGKFIRGAGYARNIEMVALGADLCLAFILPCEIQGPACPTLELHGTHGGSHCATKAREAGIPVEWEGVAA
jgi:YspA, cpYpsA-related SLOG family